MPALNRGTARRALHPVVAAWAFLTLAGPASALTVTTLADSGPGSLREAITLAPAGDTIGFLTIDGAIALDSPLPTVAKNLTIDAGAFRRIVITGQGLHRIFKIDSGTVVLRNLTLANGVGRGGNGGTPSGGGGLGAGGCLFAEGGTITLDGIRFSGCRAIGGDGGLATSAYTGISGAGGGGTAAGSPGSSSTGSGSSAGGAGFIPAENGGTGGGAGHPLGGGGTPGTAGGFGAGGGGAGPARPGGAGSFGFSGSAGGNGGFGGGGGGGGAGYGFGVGGAAGTSQPSGLGGSGSNGGPAITSYSGGGGGGAALGPALFVRNAQVTIVDSGALGSVAIAGGGGGRGALPGTAIADPLYAMSPLSVTGSLVAGTPGGLALTVTKAGGGSGTVTSTPAAVHCGTTCAASFEAGTTVTLAASPAADSSFGGWSGACTGTASCTVTVDVAKSVTATFTAPAGIPHLGNIATRSLVLTGGDVMIAGFIIQGDGPQTVTVRARGPSLVPFGVPNALPDPVLQLVAGQVVIGTNDDWQSSADAAAIQASGFAPSDARESVIRATLAPGAYTAIVSGKAGATGVAIVEVFAQ